MAELGAKWKRAREKRVLAYASSERQLAQSEITAFEAKQAEELKKVPPGNAKYAQLIAQQKRDLDNFLREQYNQDVANRTMDQTEARQVATGVPIGTLFQKAPASSTDKPGPPLAVVDIVLSGGRYVLKLSDGTGLVYAYGVWQDVVNIASEPYPWVSSADSKYLYWHTYNVVRN